MRHYPLETELAHLLGTIDTNRPIYGGDMYSGKPPWDAYKSGARGSLYKQKGSVYHGIRKQKFLEEAGSKLGLEMYGPVASSDPGPIKPLTTFQEFQRMNRGFAQVGAARAGLKKHALGARPGLFDLNPERVDRLDATFGSLRAAATTATKEFMARHASVGGRAPVFSPLGLTGIFQAREGISSPDAVLAQFHKKESSYIKRMRKLGVKNLFGQSSPFELTAGLGRTTQALASFTSTLEAQGYKVGMSMSKEGVVRLRTKHVGVGTLQGTGATAALDLHLQIGERVPLLPSYVEAGVTGPGGKSVPLVYKKPGTGLSKGKMGSTPFLTARMVGIAEKNQHNAYQIKGIRTASEHFLGQLEEVFTEFAGIEGWAGRDFDSKIRKIQEDYRKLLDFSPSADRTSLFRAHDVVVMHREESGWARSLVHHMTSDKNRPRGYSMDFNGIKVEGIQEQFGRSHLEMERMAQEAGLSSFSVKPELVTNQGVVSQMMPHELGAFFRHEDLARQGYQAVGGASLAGGRHVWPLIKSNLQMKYKAAPALGRLSVPWFTTKSQRAIEDVTNNMNRRAGQVYASIAAITDPSYILGKSAKATNRDLARMTEQMMDPMSGGVWISKSLAKSLTTDVQSQLDVTNKSHQRILNFMERHGKSSVFTMDEGRRLLEKGGVGTHIMIGRFKNTVSGVFDETILEDHIRKSGGKGAVADILMPGMDLRKYPGMARELMLSSVLEKAVPEIGTNPSRKHFEGLRKIADTLGGEIRMVPDIAKIGIPEAISEQLASEVLPHEYKSLAETAKKKYLRPRAFREKTFGKLLKAGYLPQFILGDQHKEIDKHAMDQVSNILKSTFGGTYNIESEHFAAPMGYSGGETTLVEGLRHYAPVKVRSHSYNLMARASRLGSVDEKGYIPTLDFDPDSGYKLQQRLLKRLDVWGPEGKQVADTLREVYESDYVKEQANRIRTFGELLSGRTPTDDTLQKMGLKRLTPDQVIGQYLKNVEGLEKLDDIRDPSGTYFDKQLDHYDAMKKGFVLELDEALDYDLLSQGKVEIDGKDVSRTVRRSSIYFFGPAFYEKQLASESALTEMARAEEKLFDLAVTRRARTDSQKAALVSALEDYEKATTSAIVGKKGLLSERVVQPRLRGGGWTSIIEAQNLSPARQKLGKGAVTISQEYADELGLSKVLKTRNDDFVYALMHRDPAQGAGNVAAVKMYIDQELQGRKMVVDPQVYRRAMGDTDQDTMQFLLGSTRRLSANLEKLHEIQFKGDIPFHLANELMVDEQYRKSFMGLTGGQQLSLAEALGNLEASAAAKSGAVFSQNYSFFHQLDKIVEDTDSFKRYSDLVMRIHSTKLTTGEIHTGHELLRNFMVGNQNLVTRFEQEASQVGLSTKNLALVSSNLMQVAEELATIKKAAEPNVRMLSLLEQAARSPASATGAGWMDEMVDTIVEIQKETFGGKGIPLAEFQDLYSVEAMKAAYQQSAGNLVASRALRMDDAGVDFMATMKNMVSEELNPQMRKKLYVIADYMRESMRSMNEELGKEGLLRFGTYVDRISKSMTARVGESTSEEQMYVLGRVMDSLLGAGSGKTTDRLATQLSGSLARELEFEEMADITRSRLHESKELIDSAMEKTAASATATDHLFDAVSEWWSRQKPGVKFGAYAVGGLGVLAGVKNLLFPNVVPGPQPKGPEYYLHNPPFLGYNSGPGFRDNIPVNMGEGAGMLPAPVPSYGPGIGVPINPPTMGPALPVETPIPVAESAGSSPMQPMPIMSQGQPEMDTTAFAEPPRTYMEPPGWMRPMGGDIGIGETMDYVDAGYSQQEAVNIASTMGYATESEVQVTVMNDTISQSPLEASRAMRMAEHSSFYIGDSSVA